MRRDPLPLLLLLVLAILGGGAWLTRDPHHPLWNRLVELPRVGPALERFRQGYLPGPAGPADPGPRVEYVLVEEQPRPEPVDLTGGAGQARPLGTVWVRAGALLRDAPGPDGSVTGMLPGVRAMALGARRGEWRRVAQVGLDGRTVGGWVREDDLIEPSREDLWRPEPVVPLPAVAPDARVVAQALELMGDDARDEPCDPFRLITDADGPVVDRCPGLAGQLDGLYARRTGLRPVGDAAEAILLFDSPGAYLVFRSRVSPESRRHAFAAPARGFVALAAGGRPAEQTRATLVHELVHLLNRRYLGPALPAWLDEGLAEELAMSRIAGDGRLAPASLARWQAGSGSTRLVGGGEIHRGDLRTRLRGGDLPSLERLVALDHAAFQAEEQFQLHYALSAFFIRYLLSGEAPAGAGGFRSFLAAVAGGETLDEELLLTHLGGGWPELEDGFRGWLEAS